MTVQTLDQFIYKGEQYELVALDGEKLITPQDYGMNPQELNTACYRGFYSTYEINNEELFLKEMTIGNVDDGWKPIQGIMPTFEHSVYHRAPGGSNWLHDGLTEEEAKQLGHEIYIKSSDDPSYKNLDFLVYFTGKIRLGKDEVEKAYIYILWQESLAFETVLELEFNVGKLVSSQDVSLINAQERDVVKELLKDHI